MNIRYSLIFLFSFQLIFSLLTIEAKNRPSEPIHLENSSQQQLTKELWKQDVNELLDSIRNFHPNPWRSTTEKKFKSHLEQIVSQSPSNTRAQTMLKLIAAVSLITQSGGDGHSGIWPFQEATQFNLLPLRLYAFSDGIYIIGANKNNQALIGQTLKSIAGVSIDKILEKVRPYVSHESTNWNKSWTPQYLIINELLESLNITKGTSVDILTENTSSQLKTTKLRAIPLDSYKEKFKNALNNTILPSSQSAPLYLQKVLSEKYWYQNLGNKTLYFQYNLVREENNGQSFTDFVEEIEIEIKKNQTHSLIVDVRNNRGGEDIYDHSHQIYAPFFEMINNFNVEQRELTLYVLTGRTTFSAATNFTLEVDKKTQAIFIGEAMGGRSNYYGEPERIILPNSKLRVMIATRYWNRPNFSNSAQSTIPDHLVELSSSEYFSNSDPVLKKVLELIELSSFD
jgi:hypothetical protein